MILKCNGIINVNQRARLPNEVKANRETYKSVEKCMCIILAVPTYMATPEEKQIDR